MFHILQTFMSKKTIDKNDYQMSPTIDLGSKKDFSFFVYSIVNLSSLLFSGEDHV